MSKAIEYDAGFQSKIGGYPRGLVVVKSNVAYQSLKEKNLELPTAASEAWKIVSAKKGKS